MTKSLVLANSQISRSRFSGKSKLHNVSRVRVQTPRGGRRVCARDSRRTAVSQSHMAAQPSGKFVHRPEILRLQLRVIVKDLLFRHAGGEPIQHVPNCDAQPADTRLAGAFAWLDRDAGGIVGLQWKVVLPSCLQGIVGAGWPSRNIESACNATIRIYYWIYGAICYEYHVSDTRAEALQEAP
jgi:hypothetical protein